MAKVEHYYTKFEEGCFYHIYNRTVDKQPMFRNDDNCRFFLKKYDEYLSDVTDLYAFCLLGNHFHVLLRVHPLTVAEYSNQTSLKSTHYIVSHQFQKFFQSYSMAFNKQHCRVGTLFQTPFKRVLVDTDSYFTNLVYYIHANPQNHNLIADFRDWKWSSYRSLLSNKPSKLKKDEVVNWFGNLEEFEKFHDEYREVKLAEKLFID